MLKALLVSDLHLTVNPKDEYRWALWPFLRETCIHHGVKDLFILGDLTDAKDYHSARLVNRLVSEVLRTVNDAKLQSVVILRGNHDGADPECAYFKFLGRYPYIKYIETPSASEYRGKEVLLLPHTNDPLNKWDCVEMHQADYVFMHATVRGALAENGQALDGIPTGCLATARRAKIYSGDVHVPQTTGRVTYVGAPYPVRFGDDFQGRVLVGDLANGQFESIPVPSIQRRMLIANAAGIEMSDLRTLRKGDQVKVQVQLAPSEYLLWQETKRAVITTLLERGVELHGIALKREPVAPPPVLKRVPLRPVRRKPEDILREFAQKEKLDEETIELGLEILRSTTTG